MDVLASVVLGLNDAVASRDLDSANVDGDEMLPAQEQEQVVMKRASLMYAFAMPNDSTIGKAVG